MRIRFAPVLAVLALLLVSPIARAGYTIVFTDVNGATTNNFTLDQANGQTSVDILVYLAQTGGTTGLSATGLNSAGVQLTGYDPAITQVATNSAITANDATPGVTGVGGKFDAANTIVGGSAADGSNPNNPYLTEQYTSPTDGLKAATTGADANRVFLGMFTFTSSGPSGGTTSTITANPFPGSEVDLLADGTDITNIIANATATITVTAVPEPSPLYLTGLAVPLIGVGAWFRLRRRTPTAAA